MYVRSIKNCLRKTKQVLFFRYIFSKYNFKLREINIRYKSKMNFMKKKREL